MTHMTDFLNTAIAAAWAAADVHRFHAADADKQVTSKSNYADLVTMVDRLSEERIRAVISAAYPDHTVLGEELGETGSADAPARWIVDPLDGTLNYAHGFPFYCVSVALELNGTVELGVVLDSVRGELYSAVRGQGARVNGSPLKVSPTAGIREALLSTGFNSTEADIDANLPLFERGLRGARAVRRAGAGALDLCLVARGSADGFWELTLKPWDVAAGVLILREAGGKVTGLDGSDYRLDNPQLVSSNGLIHDQLLELLNGR